jgi:hypothetical protein
MLLRTLAKAGGASFHFLSMYNGKGGIVLRV